MLKNIGPMVAIEVVPCAKVNESWKWMPEITKVTFCKNPGLGNVI